MTRDELVFHIEALAAAGADAAVLVALARSARSWGAGLRARRAVARALAVDCDISITDSAAAESGFVADLPRAESGFSGVGAVGDSSPHPGAARHPSPSGGEGIEGAGDGAANPKTLARKGLLMAVGLTPAERAIGARLVERYNLATGRCDASLPRLAADEGIDVRSARRAVAGLDALGLVRRQEQRGRGRTNRYAPDWAALARLATAAETVGAGGAGRAEAAGPGSAENRTLRTENRTLENRTPGRKPDSRVRQNPERDSHFKPGGRSRHRRRDPAQLEIPVMQAVAGTGHGRAPSAAGQAPSGDRIEAAIRGKYRGDHGAMTTMLAGWWRLDDAGRAGFADLAGFEAWLRAQGPPNRSPAERLAGSG